MQGRTDSGALPASFFGSAGSASSLRPMARKSYLPEAMCAAPASGSTRPEAITGTRTSALMAAAAGMFSSGWCGMFDPECSLPCPTS
jgi:hypothetical protein